ncbi:MAG TPA: prepilin-type N-terminal cleavage/methylation domain-containing protein [Planctomycetota bacterium]|nr:prepilin-type N-terminal cleavage/methylation domain-containing protein [Planctomycetota bacterium]
MRTPTATHGFTLIEMMLAIALGSMVVYVAIAGIRVTAQSIASANKLAQENAILRTGVVIALENTDFWTAQDQPNPLNPTLDQPLRATAPDNGSPVTQRGLAFTPFWNSRTSTGYRAPAAVSPTVTPPPGPVSQVVLNGLNENTSGWDPNAWNAAEARGWAWANLCERTPRWSGSSNRNVPVMKYKIFGRCETIASTDPSFSPHHWQQRQLDGLLRSLGAYGMFDYIPANTGLMIYEKIASGSEAGQWKVSPEWCSPDNGPYYRLASDGNLSFTLDRMSDTWGTVFLIPSRTVTAANLSKISNRRYGTGIAIAASANNSSVSEIKQLLIDGEQVDPVLHDADASGYANKPLFWPGLTVRNLRFMRTGAFINLNRIAWTNPLTGQGTELSFTCFGTTLRGARQQRLRDEPGWADPFPANNTPKPTLDSY